MRTASILTVLLLSSACAVGDGRSSRTCDTATTKSELPAGCDDPRDYDGDGLMNCFDPDGDGDGIRDEWDRGPEDETVAELHVGGTGADGPRVITGPQTFAVSATRLAESVRAGDDVLIVEDDDAFLPGQEILVWAAQGPSAGFVHSAMVAEIDGTELVIEPAFPQDIDAAGQVIVQRVPHYSELTIAEGGSLVAEAWDGAGCGVIAMRVQGEVRIEGSLDASGRGFRGGQAVHGGAYSAQQGESPLGDGGFGALEANGSGGGAGVYGDEQAMGGGGGGFGSAGRMGTDFDGNAVCAGGEAFGDAALSVWSFGGGGGGGAPDPEDGTASWNVSGAGGAGGGLIALFSDSAIVITGGLRVDGADGADAVSPDEAELGGGGAGAGGQLYLVTPELVVDGEASALGGLGGFSTYNKVDDDEDVTGGDGGEGRVRVDADGFAGVTTPDPELRPFPRKPGEWPDYVPPTSEPTEGACSSSGYFAGGGHGR